MSNSSDRNKGKAGMCAGRVIRNGAQRYRGALEQIGDEVRTAADSETMHGHFKDLDFPSSGMGSLG